jgi:hypothetical protein
MRFPESIWMNTFVLLKNSDEMAYRIKCRGLGNLVYRHIRFEKKRSDVSNSHLTGLAATERLPRSGAGNKKMIFIQPNPDGRSIQTD